jgi:hypothetical protein
VAVKISTEDFVTAPGRRPNTATVLRRVADAHGATLGETPAGVVRMEGSAGGPGFAAQALWTYVNLPYLLASGALEVRHTGTHEEHGERWERLSLGFPPAITTHSPWQMVYIDVQGLIRRHDYRPVALFGPWAPAAQYLEGYERFDGFTFATKRHAHARLPGG